MADSNIFLTPSDIEILDKNIESIQNEVEEIKKVMFEMPTTKDKLEILKIVEEKDANEEEKKVNKINSGIYLLKSCDLLKYILFITNKNKSNEYYLTDIIEIMLKNEIKTYGYLIDEKFNNEIIGINTLEQLKELENL